MRGTAAEHRVRKDVEQPRAARILPALDSFADAPRPSGRRRLSPADVLGPLVVLLVFFAGWYLLAYSLTNNFSPSGKALILPPPHQVFDDYQFRGCDARPVPPACVNQRQIWTALSVTATTAALGMTISIVCGLTLAIAMSWKSWIERSLWPYLIAVQAIPIIAITPLVIKIIGANLQARVLVTVIISLFPIVANTLFGLQSADRNQRDLFTLNRAGWLTRLIRLELPSALPAIFTGFRTSAGLAVVGAIVGDFFFSRGDTGLGRAITDYFLNNQAGLMVICALYSALLGIVFFVTFGLVSRIATAKWYQPIGRTA